jgi:probable rRNA maturation factor
MNNVMVTKKDARWQVPTPRRLQTLLHRATLLVPHPRDVRISCVFIGDAAMRKANGVYRGENKTTDVLSFVYTHTKTLLEGEVLVSVPQARRQAKEIGQSMRHELEFLFVHGVLHVLGLDHEKSTAEEKRTITLQKKILQRI